MKNAAANTSPAPVASDASDEELARITSGHRDAWLLTLRSQLFGEEIASVVACPQCGEALELNFWVSEVRLSRDALPPQHQEVVIHAEGYAVRCRPPTSADLLALAGRFLGRDAAQRLFEDYARRRAAARVEQIVPDAQLVQFVETQLTGAIGSASARVMVAPVVEEEQLALDDVMRILDEASQLRAYSHALEVKSQSLERATEELRAANEKLKSLDRLKDDFMSSVTHELRTPLTSIRALTEMMQDDEEMDGKQRRQFLAIVVAETERLTRLVNQVLDMAKIESGHAEWRVSDVDLPALCRRLKPQAWCRGMAHAWQVWGAFSL